MVSFVISLETSRNLLCCEQQLLFVEALTGAMFTKYFLIPCDNSVVGAASSPILRRRVCRKGQKLVLDMCLTGNCKWDEIYAGMVSGSAA